MSNEKIPSNEKNPEAILAREQHARFRKLFARSIAKQREYFPETAEDDLTVQCFDSFEVFLREFPDREAFEEQLQECEKRSASFAWHISEQITRIQQEGMNYLDHEALRYELPSPEDLE